MTCAVSVDTPKAPRRATAPIEPRDDEPETWVRLSSVLSFVSDEATIRCQNHGRQNTGQINASELLRQDAVVALSLHCFFVLPSLPDEGSSVRIDWGRTQMSGKETGPARTSQRMIKNPSGTACGRLADIMIYSIILGVSCHCMQQSLGREKQEQRTSNDQFHD